MAVNQRHNVKNAATFDVGTTEIAKGIVVVLNAGVVDKSGSNAAKAVGITDEIGYADKDVRVAQNGDTVLALASDSSITEGEEVISDADGKVVGASAYTGGTQYIIGHALRASTAEDELIPIMVNIHVAPDAAS